MMRCMTPGCLNDSAPADVLCPACRQQSDNSRVSGACFPLAAYDAIRDDGDPDLSADLARIAGHLVHHQHQRDAVICRQQARLDLRARIIRKLTRQRDVALDQASAEYARAEGLDDQVVGLRIQVALLQDELDQIRDLGSTNGKKPGLATLDTVPGDYSPEDMGYNVRYARIDPKTEREIFWRWYRVDGSGGY